MSRLSRRTAAAVVVALALAATSYAAQAKAKSHSIAGTLQKVDGQTLTVQTPKGAEIVMLVASSRILRGAVTIEAANLASHAGERVKVSYIESNGEKRAQSVTLASAPKTGGSAQPRSDSASKPAAKPAKK